MNSDFISMWTKRSLAAISLLLALNWTTAINAYPQGPIRIIVTFAAGATNDIVGRLIAQQLSERLKATFVVENRAGAAGSIGAVAVKNAAPDGLTLLVGNTSTLAINASLFPKLGYDPVADFDPISIFATTPSALVVKPDVPAETIAELVDLLKRNPNKYAYGSAGTGTPMHLSGELFKMQTGTTILHVPYKGSAPAMVDLLGGQVQMIFDNIPAVLPFIRSGQVRAIATTGSERSKLLPDVPTLPESGFVGAESYSFFALVAPHGTPRALIDELNKALAEIVRDPDMITRLRELGAEPVGMTPEESATFIRDQIKRWKTVVEKSGAQVN